MCAAASSAPRPRAPFMASRSRAMRWIRSPPAVCVPTAPRQPACSTVGSTAMTSGDLLVAVDIGGTFTDVTLQDAATGQAWTAKTPSIPADPSEAFVTGVAIALGQAGRRAEAICRVLHGTTVATNLILEGRAAPTA